MSSTSGKRYIGSSYFVIRKIFILAIASLTEILSFAIGEVFYIFFAVI